MPEKKTRPKVDHFIEDKKDRIEVEMNGKKETVDFSRLKAEGFIKQKQKDLFTIRCASPGGQVSLDRLKAMVKVAEKYGSGSVHLTVRQSLEILYVHHKDFDEAVKLLGRAGVKIASGGPRVRVPVACGGCEYNPHGLTDTQKLVQAAYEKFFGHPCNHKFKISFSGCPHDCIRTNEVDIGFQGVVFPAWDEKKCMEKCRLCADACREDAIKFDSKGRPIFIEKKCVFCGDCIRVCPAKACFAEKKGHVVKVGGKNGRHPLKGSVVARFVPDRLVAPVIEKTLKWYNKTGENRGRIRIGPLLRDKKNMDDYMDFMSGVLGDYAEEKPAKPRLI